MKFFSTIFILLYLLAGTALAGTTVFTYRTPESPTDRRYEYDTAVLKLALDKTKDSWGDYKLVPSPVMNVSRALFALRAGKLENPMFKLSASESNCEEFEYVPFPVDLGISGYRVFLVSDKTDGLLGRVKSLDCLNQFSIGQEQDWLDGKIFEQAGFKVIFAPNYESLFHMVLKGRFDLFARGVNEVEEEYEAHRYLSNFRLNRKIGVHYPLPRFFYTGKKNSSAARRVHEGLVRAYEDGSLKQLWDEKYGTSLEFCDFRNINFFRLENPYIKCVDDSYKQYLLTN